MNKKTLVKVLLFDIISIGILVSLGKLSPPDEKPSEKQQQDDFLEIYEDVKENVYNSRKVFYYTNNLLTTLPRGELYDLFKDAEEVYKNISVYYTLLNSGPSIPDSLEVFEGDFKQSFGELASSSVILQDYSKHMADFVNTNNLESSRKAQKALDRNPFTIMTNAASRLVFGIGGKIGMDTEVLNKEYATISEKVKQEFEAEFGSTVK